MNRIFFLVILLIFITTSAWAQPNLFDPMKIDGPLDYYEGGFYVNGVKLNLGNGSLKDRDYDGDGIIQSVSQELLNLRGSQIVISGYRSRNPENYDEIYVSHINGMDFENPKCKH